MKDPGRDEDVRVSDAGGAIESVGVASRFAVEVRLFCAAKAALKRAKSATSDQAPKVRAWGDPRTPMHPPRRWRLAGNSDQ